MTIDGFLGPIFVHQLNSMTIGGVLGLLVDLGHTSDLDALTGPSFARAFDGLC
jgi:hypothetical protein